MVDRPQSTVASVIHNFNSRNSSVSQRPGRCGRKRALNSCDERAICRVSTIHPQFTAKDVQAEAGGAVSGVSVDTIKRILCRFGLYTYRPSVAPRLNASQRAVRRRWCRQHQHWTKHNWQKVSEMVLILFL